MFLRGPPAHVGADLTDEHQRSALINALDGRQVYARDPKQGLARVKAGFVGTPLALPPTVGEHRVCKKVGELVRRREKEISSILAHPFRPDSESPPVFGRLSPWIALQNLCPFRFSSIRKRAATRCSGLLYFV